MDKMKTNIDELIDVCGEMLKTQNKLGLPDTSFTDIYRITIATLELTKQGYVMVDRKDFESRVLKDVAEHEEMFYEVKSLVDSVTSKRLDKLLERKICDE